MVTFKIINFNFRVFQDLSPEELELTDLREREALKAKYTATYHQEKAEFLENLR